MNNDKEANKKLSSNLQSVQTIILTKMVIVSCIKKHITNESSDFICSDRNLNKDGYCQLHITTKKGNILAWK